MRRDGRWLIALTLADATGTIDVVICDALAHRLLRGCENDAVKARERMAELERNDDGTARVWECVLDDHFFAAPELREKAQAAMLCRGPRVGDLRRRCQLLDLKPRVDLEREWDLSL